MDPERNIADLFAELWIELENGAFSELLSQGLPALDPMLVHHLIHAIDWSPPGEIPEQVLDYLAGAQPRDWPHPDANPNLRKINLARAIDKWFEPLHPCRSVAARLMSVKISITHSEHHKRFGDHENYFRQIRFEEGRYNIDQSRGWVILKAPLRPPFQEENWSEEGVAEDSSSAMAGSSEAPKEVADAFDNICLARDTGWNCDLMIEVLDDVVDFEPLPLLTRVGIVPLAEESGDLVLIPVRKNGHPFVEIRPANEGHLANRAKEAVEKLCAENVHIGIFPELCVTPAIRQAISAALTEHSGDSQLRLVVAGSGLCDDASASRGCSTEEGGPFNECTVFHYSGRPLWHQRKMKFHAMPAEDLRAFKVKPKGEAPHRELGKESREMFIVEHDEIGRMLTLICEDLVRESPGKRVRREFVPDWIFAPILDGSIDVGRWVHREAWEAARTLNCRIVVANSMTLAARKGGTESCAIGLCCDDRHDRRVALPTVALSPTLIPSSPVVEVVEWTPQKWRETTVTAAPTDESHR